MVIEQKWIVRNRPRRNLKELKGIVLHWTANVSKGADADAHYKYFNNANRSASAHYIVDDKKVVQLIPDMEVAWHVGDKPRLSNLPYRKQLVPQGGNPNDYFIGVEMCVNKDGNWIDTLRNTRELLQELFKRYGFDSDNLYRHYDITGKDCPKMYLPVIIGNEKYDWLWQEFKNSLNPM